ncbi:uncharacterized protein ColSpa_04599 [Colletotrichum spaethianum]|uniref:Uncharacterized protein n=1 Tax=Colletotrichum spaethianum TaxID=700344 RepID=A0AA37LDJ5_9PEZI|nr:uncharacterized protein ColSpa_04599 [Colletotrichum spaethianum]GKT44418.1 hypothetical protein ColSpa_04599 [Colletotrichum spaethianum]
MVVWAGGFTKRRSLKPQQPVEGGGGEWVWSQSLRTEKGGGGQLKSWIVAGMSEAVGEMDRNRWENPMDILRFPSIHRPDKTL